MKANAHEVAPRLNRARNRILANLPGVEAERLAPHLELVELHSRDLMFDVNEEIENVWFPEDCVASIIGIMANGSAVETATVGQEGMIGLPVFHGTDRTSSQAFCQVPGRAWRLPSNRFRAELEKNGALVKLLHRYAQAVFTLVAQSSACNRLHPVVKRCARWILLTHDRVAVDTFSLTPGFLSQMLGVPREGVADAVRELERSGCLSYGNPMMTVVDRPALEAASCECYGIVRSEFDRLLAEPDGVARPNSLDGIPTSRDGKSTIGEAVPESGENDPG